MPENTENTNKTEKTENTNKKQKTIKMIAALVLTFTALIVAFTLPNFSNNPKPEPTSPTEPSISQSEDEELPVIVDCEVIKAYHDELKDNEYEDDRVFVKNYEEFQSYVTKYGDIKLENGMSVLERFSQKFFENNNLAIKGHTVLTGHTEYCFGGASQLDNELAISITQDNYYTDADAMPAPIYEFMFIVIDKDIESVDFVVHEIDHSKVVYEDSMVVYKPIIYLYPEEEMNVQVKFDKEHLLTHVYPKYNNGWTVFAKSNGDLVDLNTGRSQYCLYYESLGGYEMTNEGFVVKGEDTISFLEEKLAVLGLSEREANEFIIYWLPKLESNNYNYIRFATMEEIENNMGLDIMPQPDSLIRVVMVFKGLEEPIEVNEQVLTTPERVGFTVVEWGGTEIK